MYMYMYIYIYMYRDMFCSELIFYPNWKAIREAHEGFSIYFETSFRTGLPPVLLPEIYSNSLNAFK